MRYRLSPNVPIELPHVVLKLIENVIYCDADIPMVHSTMWRRAGGEPRSGAIGRDRTRRYRSP